MKSGQSPHAIVQKLKNQKLKYCKIEKLKNPFAARRIPRNISINFTTWPALFRFPLRIVRQCVPLSGHDRQQRAMGNRQPATGNRQHGATTATSNATTTTMTTFQCRLALKCRSFSGSSTFVADKSTSPASAPAPAPARLRLRPVQRQTSRFHFMAICMEIAQLIRAPARSVSLRRRLPLSIAIFIIIIRIILATLKAECEPVCSSAI